MERISKINASRSDSMALWSHISNGALDSLVLEYGWEGIPFRTPWIIFRPVISEGSISLLITLTTALSLAFFFYAFKNASGLTIQAESLTEELSKMDISYLIMSGNIVSGIKRTLEASASVSARKLLPFLGSLAVPIIVWSLASFTSGICQASVHSVTVTRAEVSKVPILRANVRDIVASRNLYDQEIPMGGYALTNPDIAQAIIQGRDYQTSGFFLINSTFCGGTYDKSLLFTTTCLQDATSCDDLPYSIGPGPATSIMIQNTSIVRSLNLRVLETGYVNAFGSGVIPFGIEDKPRSFKVPPMMGYYLGLSGSSLGALPLRLSGSESLDNQIGYLTGSRLDLNFTVWAGVCRHLAKLCSAAVDMGNITLSNCTSVALPIPNFEINGVGPPVRNHFTFRSALSTVLAQDLAKVQDGSFVVHKTLGILSLAWYLSLLKLRKFRSASVPALKTVSFEDSAIAMDLMSTILIIFFFLGTSIWALWVALRTRNREAAIRMSWKRLKWNPMTRYASEMSKKHGLDFDHGCWELPSSLDERSRSSSSATLNEDSDSKQRKFYPLKEIDNV